MNPNRKNNTPSHKRERLESRIREILAEEFLSNPFKGVLVTVVRVVLTPDDTARIFLSIMGEGAEDLMKTIQERSPYYRHILAEKLNLRYTPLLIFLPDREQELQEILQRVTTDKKSGRDKGHS